MTGTAGGLRLAVVGAGAVGGYVGGMLAAAGGDVRFLARGETLAALRRDGLRITGGPGGPSADRHVPAVRASADPAELGEVDAVLLCVKTPQLTAAARALAPLLGEDTAVVTVQNGVEAPDQVASVLGRDRVLPGLARVVAVPVRPGVVRHLGPPGALGFTEWDGGVSERVLRLREALRAAALTAAEPADVWAELWAKFLVVVPVGGLGAATGGATVGELRSRAGTRRLLVAAMREIHGTAVRLGIGLPEDAVDTAVGLVDRQAPDATSSLQRDVLAGRPSELDAWTGAAVRLAARAGHRAPVLELLHELLAAREALAVGAPH
ncbi:2-dehydropantoate 2-reductase [Kitasatospora sp. NPDC093679]|uniref:2-dehydropantoate 2-reductase n=1 Tax=Kitasatospora sp. NPDC093679 TaxID=3154983 RepID=UPI003442A9F0